MRHAIAIPLAALLCGASLSASAQTPINYSQAKALADRDEASLPADVAEAMRSTQADTLKAGVEACATPQPDTSPFVVVAQLDAQGRIEHTWRQGTTPLSICMEKFLRGRILLVPARSPFYVSYELSFTP